MIRVIMNIRPIIIVGIRKCLEAQNHDHGNESINMVYVKHIINCQNWSISVGMM